MNIVIPILIVFVVLVASCVYVYVYQVQTPVPAPTPAPTPAPAPAKPTVLDFSKLKPDLSVSATYGLPGGGKFLLYNSTDDTPNYLEVMQGGLGDCGFDSTMAEIAYKNPIIIKNMITQKGDLYYVSFYNFVKNVPFQVIVTAELPLDSQNEGFFDKFYVDKKTQKPVIWSHIILKALACLIGNYPDIKFVTGNLNGYAGLTSPIIKLSLLKSIQGLTNVTQVTDKSVIENVSNKNFMCVGGTEGISNVVPATFTKNGDGYDCPGGKVKLTDKALLIYNSNGKLTNCLIHNHAYSMLDYKAGQVILRNPWGTYSIVPGYVYPNGIIKLPIEQFKVFFTNILTASL